MNVTVIFTGIIALIFIWWNLWVSMKIIKYLKSKGEEASLFKNGIFVRGKIFTYLPLYKRLSLKADGKVGQLYYNFYVSFILFLASLLLGLVLVS